MREFSTPLGDVVLPRDRTLVDDVRDRAAQTPDQVLFVRDGERGPGEEIDAATFAAEVDVVARGLLAAGIDAGDRVVLMSRTRYEWTLLDYALWAVGAIVVPVYPSAPPEQVAWVLRDSGAVAAVVELPEHAARLREACGEDPETAGTRVCDRLWVIDPAQGPDAVAALTTAGTEVPLAVLQERRDALGPDDVATLIYTSGTTGRPKGCVLTHATLLAEVAVGLHELAPVFARPDAGTVLFLPLAHVFARIVQIGCVQAGVRVAHAGDVTALVPMLRTHRPTFLLAVPRVFETLFNTASQQATADGRGGVFERAVATAIDYSKARERGRVGPALRARHRVLDRVVYARLREALGGRCTVAVSGGAPLGERLAHFYRGAGVTVLEGWGLTETAAALTVNVPEAHKVGSVGRPLPGTAVRVADDGELWVRGPQVFGGYWGDDAATAEVLEPDGWLHTGDVGEVDDEGFVRVTGRKQEILVTAGGKHVSPTVLEDRLRTHLLISQALVVGDRRPYVAAVLTLDAEAVVVWAGSRGRRLRSTDPAEVVAALAHDPDLLAEVQAAVDDANAAVSRAEAIRRFTVLDRDWTEEGGQLTPSLKLRRHVVLRECRDEIADLYR
ncbi:long-chain fatty acid--CoA ligase [Nocardioides sp.]|uniref:AMP-dependent synthetase/ligase n=1 Tax=Nocardioides sp. TaxID=35761 RepID=UPI003513293B